MATRRRRLGWGVIGCGWVARDYVLPAVVASGNGRLVVACDRDPRALAALPAGTPATADLDAALAAPGLDAVYVATPNDAHRPIVEAAAAAGKHVLCEKPMAACAADARAMVDACRAAGVCYATAFDQRFHAAHEALAGLVREGALGVVTQARLHYACWLPADWAEDNWRIDPARAGGGALVDLAPHGVDLLEAVLDDQWAALAALVQRRVHRYAVEDGAVLMGRFAGGALATMNVAYNCPERYPRRVLELIGTESRALALDTMGQTPGGTLRLTDAASGRERAVELADDRSPFVRQLEAFAAALLADRPYPFEPEADLRRFELLQTAFSEASCR